MSTHPEESDSLKPPKTILEFYKKLTCVLSDFRRTKVGKSILRIDLIHVSASKCDNREQDVAVLEYLTNGDVSPRVAQSRFIRRSTI